MSRNAGEACALLRRFVYFRTETAAPHFNHHMSIFALDDSATSQCVSEQTAPTTCTNTCRIRNKMESEKKEKTGETSERRVLEVARNPFPQHRFIYRRPPWHIIVTFLKFPDIHARPLRIANRHIRYTDEALLCHLGSGGVRIPAPGFLPLRQQSLCCPTPSVAQQRLIRIPSVLSAPSWPVIVMLPLAHETRHQKTLVDDVRDNCVDFVVQGFKDVQ